MTLIIATLKAPATSIARKVGARLGGIDTSPLYPTSQPQGQADAGDGEHADQDRAEHVAMAEHGDHQEADRRQQGGGFGEGAHGQQRGRVVDDDAGGLQADQPEEQPDPGTHGEAQAHRNAVEQPLA